MATPQEPQRFVERHQPKDWPSSEVPSELVVWQARQRFALTLGVILVVLLLVGGGMALLLLKEWRTPIVQAPPSSDKPLGQFAQVPSPSPPANPFAQVPSPSPPANPFAQVPSPSPPANPAVAPPAATPSPPTVTVHPPQPPAPQPIPSPHAQPQQPPPPPKPVLDYLEQLRRIEMQRKKEAKNIWLALAALGDLVKAMQGIASTGDILDTPSNYDPQKTLQTFATYQANFAQLRQRLHQLQPPPECLPLHQAYDQALLSHLAVIGKLQEKVQMRDLAGTAMMGLTAQGQINSALQTADSELAAVCARYGIQKFFTIGDE